MIGLLAFLIATGVPGAIAWAILRLILVPREERAQQNLSDSQHEEFETR